MSTVRRLIALPFFAVGGLLALYGVFALVYNGEGTGPTSVRIVGQQMKAHLAGALSLLLAAVVVAAGVAIARGRRLHR